ncbi:MAG: glycosyltransferase [Paracoccaceae bacterium]
MILIDAGKRDARAIEAKTLFASQLAARGHRVVIDENTIPDALDRNQKYETAPFLAEVFGLEISRVILIGADDVCDETLRNLRSYKLASGIDVAGIGRFSDQQALVNSRSKLAYALGREPRMIDLNEFQQKQLLKASVLPLVATAPLAAKPQRAAPEVFVFLPPERLEEDLTLPMLGAMNHLADFRLNIIISGKGRDIISKSKYSSLTVYGLAELATTTFAKLADIIVFYGDGVPGERMATLALDILRHSGVVIDCTGSAAFVASGAPVLRGPQEIAAMPNFLEHSVLVNRAEIARQIKSNAWLEANSIERLELALDLPKPRAAGRKTSVKSRKTVFYPTNGNGLGHAQRCSLIAAQFRDAKSVVFAAFPSCIPLINSKGFACLPLVQKSDEHDEAHANDLVNYLRLGRSLNQGDRFVFDGGYVFDSVYRTIMEKSLSATWVRRGLWRAGQITDTSLDREKVFEKVIIPSEAFDELNAAYSYGRHVHHVGPIVQNSTQTVKDNKALRQKLGKTFGKKINRLVVTMLGGGVAADRSAQMQTLCTLFERQKDCLHLVVVWPNSKVSSGIFGWKNTRVVKTKNALALCQAADFVVSAVGYNSFHELLYHRVPAILVPQTAPYMDDQERRARAASERGLAETVLASEFLLLEREVAAFLHGGKAALIRKELAGETFVERGNKAAAQIIQAGC